MESDFVWRAGDLLVRARRPGFARWSGTWFGIGIVVSLLAHLVIFLGLLAIPWDKIMGRADPGTEVPPSWFGSPSVPGLETGIALVVYALFGVAAWWWARKRPDRVNGWAMSSAVCCFAALLILETLTHVIATSGGNLGPRDRGPNFLPCFLLMGLSILTGTWALVSSAWRRIGTRGWPMALSAVVASAWFGIHLWDALVFPVFPVDEGGLELVTLPEVDRAAPHHDDPWIVQPVLVLLADGSVVVRREVLVDESAPEDTTKLERYLANQARQMEKDHLDKENRKGPLFPDGSVLLLPDATTDFTHVTRIAQLCTKEGIQIWKLHLGVRRPEKPRLGYYFMGLPRIFDGCRLPVDPPTPDPYLLKIEVVEPGSKLAPEEDVPWRGEGPFRFGEDRVLRYSYRAWSSTDPAELAQVAGLSAGELRRTDIGPGVVWGDVAKVLNALTAEDHEDVEFWGWFPDR